MCTGMVVWNVTVRGICNEVNELNFNLMQQKRNFFLYPVDCLFLYLKISGVFSF